MEELKKENAILKKEIQKLKQELNNIKKHKNGHLKPRNGVESGKISTKNAANSLSLLLNKGKSGTKSGGISKGKSQADAKNSLALLLNKGKSGTNKGGISKGKSRADATNSLALLLNKGKSGGVSKGKNRADATNSLALLLNKKNNNNSNNKSEVKVSQESKESGNNDDIFKKYDRMLKFKMPFDSAINRMRQDGLSQDLINQFTKKHKKGNDSEAELNPKDLAKKLGLNPKQTYPKSDIKLKKLHWTPIKIKNIPKSVGKYICYILVEI